MSANLLRMAQKDGCIKEIPVEYLIPIITGAIRFFFSSAPYIKAVYEIDVDDTEVIKRYADYIVDILLNGLLLPAAKQ
jgi:hypothetical protein